MSLTLKEEYEARKRHSQEKLLLEAEYNFQENFILLEAIDQAKLDQIADAIQKLDAILSSGDLASKLPALNAAVDAAAADMQKFIANGSVLNTLATLVGKDKAFNPITKSMTLFSALTKLFRDDLPGILKTFRLDQAIKAYNSAGKNAKKPQTQPTAGNNAKPATDQTGSNPGTGTALEEDAGSTDANNIRLLDLLSSTPALASSKAKLVDLFKKALVPSGILGFFGLKKTPYIPDPGAIATELMTLTPAQFKELSTNISRVQIPVSADDKKDLMDLNNGKVPEKLAQDASSGKAADKGQEGETGSKENTPQGAQQAASGRLASALTSLKTLDDAKILSIVKSANTPADFVIGVEKATAKAKPKKKVAPATENPVAAAAAPGGTTNP